MLLVGYTLAMACTLVYSADHFVFDILLGWTYATAAFLVGNWWWHRHVARLAARRDQASTRRPAR